MIVKSIMCNDKIFAQFGYITDSEGRVVKAYIDCLFRHTHKCRCEVFDDFDKAERVWNYITDNTELS